MPPASATAQAEEDRNRVLASLMEEWSPLQRDLMAWLHLVGGEISGFRIQDSERSAQESDLSSPQSDPSEV